MKDIGAEWKGWREMGIEEKRTFDVVQKEEKWVTVFISL